MEITERFLKYVSFHTTSDEYSDKTPSTDRQKRLGEYLTEEFKKLGIEASIDEKGYVYAFLPASDGMENSGSVGFIAHMDTSPAVSGENVRPRVLEYAGGDITLSENVKISEKDYDFLKNYIGQHLIVTDGKTLLGADDKAGIAEIVSACEYFIDNPDIKHRGIAVCFTPDEEIGRGADFFDFSRFKSDTAYTVDGGELGEIEYENFNAASAVFRINGINIHPGSAKNKMKNAVLIASRLIAMLPEAETPAHTEGYEGFYHVGFVKGDESSAEIEMIIRDHDMAKFEERKSFVRNLTNYLNSVYGNDTVELELKDSYYNMKEKILPHFYLVERACEAMRKAGAEPRLVPIRGGTDGARLSYMGLPCPNLSTGGANFHSIHEFVSIESMEKMVRVITELCQ